MGWKANVAAATIAAAVLVGGGAYVANAADEGNGSGTGAAWRGSGTGGPGGGASQDTPVTSATKTKVIAAVTASDPSVTITEVRQDPDGSYDALGTAKGGAPVFYDVSKDLGTVTQNTMGAPGGMGQGPAPTGAPGAASSATG